MKEEKVNATWSYNLDVECPHCNEINDLLLVDEWWFIFGEIGRSTEGVNYKHECQHCEKTFLIEDIDN